MASTDEEKREEEELLPSTNQLSIVPSEYEAVEVTLEEMRCERVTLEEKIRVAKEKSDGTFFSTQSTVCECQREKARGDDCDGRFERNQISS
jgi:hypothetical protein